MPDDLVRSVPRARSLEEGKRNLEEFGVTIHEDFLTPDMLLPVQERFIEQVEQEREQGVAWFNGEPEEGRCVEAFIRPGSWIGTPKGEPYFQSVSFLVNKGRVFIDLAASELSLAYASHLLGDRFNMIALSGIVVGKGAPLQNLHFDQLVMPFVAPIPAVMNIFVLLTDFDDDMGATRFVPGTHLMAQAEVDQASSGPLYGYFPDQQDTVPAVAKAGGRDHLGRAGLARPGRIHFGQNPPLDFDDLRPAVPEADRIVPCFDQRRGLCDPERRGAGPVRSHGRSGMGRPHRTAPRPRSAQQHERCISLRAGAAPWQPSPSCAV